MIYLISFLPFLLSLPLFLSLYMMDEDKYHQFVVFMRLLLITTSLLILLLIVPCFASSIKADIDLTEEQRKSIAMMPDK